MALLFLGFLVLVVWLIRLQGRVTKLEDRDAERVTLILALEARLRDLARSAPPAERTAPVPEAPGPAATTAPAVRPSAAPRGTPLAAERPVREAGTPDTAVGLPPSPPPRVQQRVPERAAPPPPLPPRPAPPPPPMPPSPPPSPAFDWEALVGVKLFSWVAGVAMALAAVFFLGYSIQSGWLQPPVRMAIGTLVGLGLIAICERRAAREYAVTANAMDAAGIVTLFATFFASYSLWHLIDAPTTFVLFVLVTAAAVTLSIRRDSVFVALLGLVGGFSTPALLATGQDRPISLFGYLLLLNAGLAWVAYRKRWVPLLALSLVFTTLYQWSWSARFLTADRLSLAIGIFLVFPVLAVLALAVLGRGTASPAGATRAGRLQGPEAFRLLTAANAAFPLLFAVYLAAVPAYGGHYGLLFGFLLCLDAGLFFIAVWRGPHGLHLLGAATTLLVLLVWLDAHYAAASAGSAWPAVLAVVGSFVVFYLATGMVGRRAEPPLGFPATLAAHAAPLLLVAFPVMAANDAGFASATVGFAVLFLLLGLVAAYAVYDGAPLAYYLAAVLALATEAVWSVLHLGPARLQAALVIYVGFGLLCLAVPLVGAARNRVGHGAMALSLVSHLFLAFVAVHPSLSVPPWPMFGAVALLDLAVAAAALYLRRGDTHLWAVILTQGILIVWVVTARSAPWPLIGILAACATAAGGLVETYLARRRKVGPEGEAFDAAAGVGVLLAQLLLVVAAFTAGAPGVGTLALAHVALAVALLTLATLAGSPILAVVAVLPAWLATWSWQALHPEPAFWRHNLGFALPLYLVFLAYPLVLGSRVGRRSEPHLAAVLASAWFFHVGRLSLVAGGYGDVLGVLPLAQAVLLGGLLVGLLRLESPGERVLGRLALVAGTLLAFVTVAVPLQLEKEWITVGWALEGAALAWLFRRVPHRGLLWSAMGLLAIVFVRLAVNPEVFVYEARGSYPILNWYLYTYLACAGAMFLAASWFSQTDDRPLPGLPRASQVLPAGATVLLFLLLNIEIADFFSVGRSITFTVSAGLAQDLTYTLGWAVFAVALLAAGIWRRSSFARMSALVLLTVTVLKGFLHDMARLGGLYRVFSFVGLAICLALVAVVLQRFVLRRKSEEANLQN